METSIVPQKKNNLPLIIALCIPVLMIVLVAAFVYLPGFGKHPAHNFLYITGYNTYYYGNQREYFVSGGHLVHNPQPAYPSDYNKGISPPTSQPIFYIYDIVSGKSTELTFVQAQKYQLDPSIISEDGYRVERGNYGGGDFFFGGGSGDYNSWFIKGHNRSIKLNLKLSSPDYYNFEFLGWITN